MKPEVMKKSPFMPARYWRESVVLRRAMEVMRSALRTESLPTSTLARMPVAALRSMVTT